MKNGKLLLLGLLVVFVFICIINFLPLVRTIDYLMENRRLSADSKPKTPPPMVAEHENYLIALPFGMDEGRKHPMIVSLGDDPAVMVRFWAPIAYRHQWIILASKKFYRDKRMEPVGEELSSDIRFLISMYPIDASRIVAGGFSAGAMGSHFLIYTYPDIFAGVIINSGMIHEKFQTDIAGYPHDKLAAFLGSLGDTRYDQMHQDQRFLETIGWKTTWIEFSGGHTYAPESTYEEAVQWLERNFSGR